MVGRHAQMIPKLISTLDHTAEGAVSSDHVSASGEYGKEPRTAEKSADSSEYVHEKSERLTLAIMYARPILAPQRLSEQ